MKYKVGFIGCGNMASAIIGGLKAHAGIDASEIIAADASETARAKAADALGICTTGTNTDVCRSDHRYDCPGQDTCMAW